MNDKNFWLKFAIGFVIQAIIFLFSFWGAYQVLKSDVTNIKSELAATDIAVMNNELVHIKDQNKDLERKVDLLIQAIITGD